MVYEFCTTLLRNDQAGTFPHAIIQYTQQPQATTIPAFYHA